MAPSSAKMVRATGPGEKKSWMKLQMMRAHREAKSMGPIHPNSAPRLVAWKA